MHGVTRNGRGFRASIGLSEYKWQSPTYASEEEAAAERDRMVLFLYSPDTDQKLNFPQNRELHASTPPATQPPAGMRALAGVRIEAARLARTVKAERAARKLARAARPKKFGKKQLAEIARVNAIARGEHFDRWVPSRRRDYTPYEVEKAGGRKRKMTLSQALKFRPPAPGEPLAKVAFKPGPAPGKERVPVAAAAAVSWKDFNALQQPAEKVDWDRSLDCMINGQDDPAPPKIPKPLRKVGNAKVVKF